MATPALFRRWSFRRSLLGSLRVCLYLGLVCVGIAAATARNVKAELSEQSFRLAKDLAPIAHLLKDATQLRINGEPINFSATVVENSSVSEVLDKFEDACKKHPGPFSAQIDSLSAALPDDFPGIDYARKLLKAAALSRLESDSEGTLMCFTSSDTAAMKDSRPDFETSDLSALGNLRHITVSRGDAKLREEKLIRIVSVWTEGRFNLDALTPPTFGDSPGTDSTFVPRPPKSTRFLAAETVGGPYAIRIYETTEPPREIVAFYDKAMADWSPIGSPGREDEARGYIKGARPVIVSLSTNDVGHTVVTITEMGAATEDLPAVTRGFFRPNP